MRVFLFVFVLMFAGDAMAACEAYASAVEKSMCLHGVEESEMELAAAQDGLLAAIPEAMRPNVQQEQVTWFTYRNSVCELEGQSKETEEEKADAMILCTARMNRERTAMLEESRIKTVEAQK